MQSFPFRSALLCLFTCVALAGCSEKNPDFLVEGDGAQEATEFSAEDKAAAQALSIANNTSIAKSSALGETDEPYRKAMLCSEALDFLVKRVRTSGGLTDGQIAAIGQLKSSFDQRVSTLAADAGKTQDNVEQDRLELAGEGLSNSDKGRMAIACMQMSETKQ